MEKNYAKNPKIGISKGLITPDDYGWKTFRTEKGAKKFCQEIGKNRLEYTEHISRFNPGLNWPVLVSKNKILPLKECISQKKIDHLKNMVKSVRGYYVYYRK